MRQKVAVITINFKGLSDTLECLDSLVKAQKYSNFDTVVVHYDDGSNSDELVNHQIAPKLILSTENLGFAGFNNLALKTLLSDDYSHFVLLNNDTTVSPTFLEPLVNALQDEKIAFVSPKIYFPPGKEFHSGYEQQNVGKIIWYAGGVIDWQNMLLFHRGVDEVDRGQFDKPIETDFATGCCVAFRRDVLDSVGFMPHDYFMYYEDAAWCRRVKQHSLKSVYEPRSHMYHKNASSTGGSGSSLHTYYQSINRFRFAMQFAPLKTKLVLIKQFLTKALTGNERERSISIHALLYKRLSSDSMQN